MYLSIWHIVYVYDMSVNRTWACMCVEQDTLDQQLKGTTLGESFERVPGPAPAPQGQKAEGETREEEDLRPVDVNMNLVMSLLESYSRQEGQPGPVSNLLGDIATQLGGQKGGAPAP